MNIKNLVACVVIAGCLSQASAQGISPKVTVSNLEDKTGTLLIGWYTNATAFPQPSQAAFYKSVKVANLQQYTVTFDHIPEGSYAIAIFLDENGNGKLDKNFLGIPKEKYGFSNNVSPAMRAAKFEEALFKLAAGNANISIKLK